MTKLSKYVKLIPQLYLSRSYQKRRQAQQEKVVTKEVEQDIKNEIRTRIQQAHKQSEVCTVSLLIRIQKRSIVNASNSSE